MGTYYRWRKSTAECESTKIRDSGYWPNNEDEPIYLLTSRNVKYINGRFQLVRDGTYYRYPFDFGESEYLNEQYFEVENITNQAYASDWGTKIAFYSGHVQIESGNCYRLEATVSPGTFVGYVYSTNASAYPNGGESGGYYYDQRTTVTSPSNPPSITVPDNIKGGSTITISWGAASATVGSISGYELQRRVDSGAWVQVFRGNALSATNLVEKGTNTVAYRVRAYDANSQYSGYATSSTVTVVNNEPPSAPASISVTTPVAGEAVTITLTAATDPDGTIASYVYERSVDGSAWQQIANVNSLTQTDTISADWGTVAYRACAVDDDGASGPYVTSSTTVVNSGWVIISGPAADMGSQPKPFTFAITPSISGTTTSEQITVDVTLDGNSIYNEAVAPGTEIELEIDTRLMRTGDHAISVSATCASFLPAANEYSFSVPVITIPDGGRMDQLEGPDGEVIFPVTIARAVAGLENVGVESKVHPGAYTGSGTYGSGNPNSLALEFEPKLVIIQGTSGRMAVLIKPSGVGISIGASNSTTLNVTWDGESVSWYNGVNAANQMNTNNETYSYTAFG